MSTIPPRKTDKKSKPTTGQLKRAINLIFDKYDTDKSGYLD